MVAPGSSDPRHSAVIARDSRRCVAMGSSAQAPSFSPSPVSGAKASFVPPTAAYQARDHPAGVWRGGSLAPPSRDPVPGLKTMLSITGESRPFAPLTCMQARTDIHAREWDDSLRLRTWSQRVRRHSLPAFATRRPESGRALQRQAYDRACRARELLRSSLRMTARMSEGRGDEQMGRRIRGSAVQPELGGTDLRTRGRGDLTKCTGNAPSATA
ncbi:hypothetical protein OH77DRAFT_1168188 [Trametes cingulata]|nr:hypothetical protein OH77DRAFT_1168188 [Trametes cingulata]